MRIVRTRLVDGHPPPLAGRTIGGLYKFLNLVALSEVGTACRFACHGADEVAHFDRLEVVETDLMARGDAEGTIGLVLGRSENGPEAAQTRFVVDEVDPKLVEPLLAEQDRTPGAVNLEVVLHLAAGGDPVRFDVAGRAIREADQEAGDVVDLNGPGFARAWLDRPIDDRRLDRGDQLSDRAN